AEREQETRSLRGELDRRRETEQDLRAHLGTIDGRHTAAVDKILSDRAAMESELSQAQDEQAKLRQQIGQMKRDAESSWASERMENALLRERINDIAAEVARLTGALDGPDSPIATFIPAGSEAPDATRANGSTRGEHGDQSNGGPLADRIRALQVRASRLTSSA